MGLSSSHGEFWTLFCRCAIIDTPVTMPDLFRYFSAILLLVMSTRAAVAGPLDNWHWRSPTPQGNPLYGIHYENGNWIAVGESGTLIISSDGTNWTAESAGTDLDLHASAYGSGNHVVVGADGTIETSPDAIDWQPQYGGTFYSLNAVIYAANQFVAVGDATTILTSPDGAAWTQRSSGNWPLYDIFYTNGLYVCAGGTNEQAVILTSTNGADWTLRLLIHASAFKSIAYNDGEFAAAFSDHTAGFDAGGIWASADGLNWEQAIASGQYPLQYISPSTIFSYKNSWLLATVDEVDAGLQMGGLFVSSNLLDWSEVISNMPAVTAIDSSVNELLASRLDGTVISAFDATNWVIPGPAELPQYSSDLEFLNGSFVCVGGNQTAFSRDGETWTNLDTSTNSVELLSITFGNGRYVAGSGSRNVLTSLDGVNWTNPAPQLNIAPAVANVAVAYGNGVFVGASGYLGDTLTSPDGLQWTVQQLGTNAGGDVYFNDVKFGGGRFVSVGGSAIATSTDGTNWFFSNTNQYVYSVACGEGTYVAVGPYGALTSHDGTNWISTLSAPLNCVAYGAGYFVAVGAVDEYPDFFSESEIWYSTDGQHWISAPLATSLNFYELAYGDGAFVLVGPNSAVIQSDSFVSLSLVLSPAPAVILNGPAPATYRFDYTDVLLFPPDWGTLGTFKITQTPAVLEDPSRSRSTTRFYRAVLLQ